MTTSKSSPNSLHGNIVLNFSHKPLHEFGEYAQAFYGAGKSLATNLAEANGYSDLDACPIIFLYRHALELSIKGVVIAGKEYFRVLGKEDVIQIDIFKNHQLSRFFPALKKIFQVMKWDWDFENDDLRSFEDFQKRIREIEAIDLDSFAFRYPVTREEKPTLEKHFHFNVFELCDRMGILIEGLFGAIAGVENSISIVSEQ